MYPSEYNFYDNISLFESDLNEVNLKDPDRLYSKIENNIQSLIDVYSIYDPFNSHISELTDILNRVIRIHEECNLDVGDEYDEN